MLRATRPGRSRLPGRHRLGTPGLVYCREYPEIAAALTDTQRSWLSALLMPARHSWGGMRREAVHPQSALPVGC